MMINVFFGKKAGESLTHSLSAMTNMVSLNLILVVSYLGIQQFGTLGARRDWALV